MKRFSAIFTLIVGLFLNHHVKSQSIITGLDTLCVNNKLQLSTTDTTSTTHYWGFCSAYMNNIPTGSSIAAGTGLDAPTSIDFQKDGNNYYVFTVNAGGTRDLIRYDFGTNLTSVPLATNLGNFSSMIPSSPKGFQLINANGNWYGFLVGGVAGNYHIIRMNFGATLQNAPVLDDLGDLGGLITNPQDIHLFFEGGSWYALVMTRAGKLYSINFGVSFSTAVPVATLLTTIGGAQSGIWPVLENGNWYLFHVNSTAQSIGRIDFGNSLANPVLPIVSTPVIAAPFNTPRDISFIKDCGAYYAFVTNEGDNTITKLTFMNSILNVPTASNLGNFAGLDAPIYLTHYIREKDNIISYTANNLGNTISRLEYNSCAASSIPSSTLLTPPPVTYSTPGTYNVYYIGDEGLPTMKVECKLITILPQPYMEITKDTAICQGDTIQLVANGIGLYSIYWDPIYNTNLPIDTTTIYVHPNENYTYVAHMEFLPNGGCAFDTSMTIKVNQIKADAGPDVFIADGSYTVLGGPNTSYGIEFKYKWRPYVNISDSTVVNPSVNPYNSQAYYFEVFSDSSRCVAYDTVWVYTECTDVNLPNAFNPVSDIAKNRTFGILNNNLSRLEYFRIYNRWGNLVFETTNPKKQWDGTQNNIELPPDNYVWIVDGYCSNGKHIKKQGTVLLVK